MSNRKGFRLTLMVFGNVVVLLDRRGSLCRRYVFPCNIAASYLGAILGRNSLDAINLHGSAEPNVSDEIGDTPLPIYNLENMQ